MKNKKMPKNFGKKISKGTIKRLFGYIKRKYLKQFIAVFVCIIVSALANVYGSMFLKTLIDDYISPLLLEENPVFTGLLKAITTMGMIYAVGILASYLYNRIMAVVSQGVLKDVRDEMFSKMETFPIEYFDTNTHGDIMSHYTNDADTLREMFGRSLPQTIQSLTTIIGAFVAMLIVNVPLTIFIVVFLTLMIRVTKSVAGKSSKFFIKQQESLGEVNGYVEEMINGQKVIKVFCHEEESEKDFDKINDELFEHMYTANKYANILMPIMNNMGNIEYVLVAIVGGLLAANGLTSLTAGSMVTFLSLTKTFTQPMMGLAQQVNTIAMGLAGADRIFKLLDTPSEENEGKVTLVRVEETNDDIIETDKNTGKWAWKVPDELGGFKYVDLRGYIQLNNVTFSYDGKNDVLHDITLYAKPGQKIAFVGATGAGKTTITNLINRFYDIKDGEILYDGINIKDINKYDLRLSLGMVLQDTNLFTGTIKDNIKYARQDATDEEVINAAKIANADEFINLLPDGYDTMLTNNGANLSQGQRQLLSIARAALADPPVMILDEATSSIDTRTERIVQDGMDNLMNGRTVFVIAHRLSTVRNSKAIIVLEHGKIIERGEHEALIAEKGQYYQLYTGAFELE